MPFPRASAQDDGPPDAMAMFRQAYQAEHRAWSDDVERWRAEHEQAQDVLRAMLQQFEGDSQLGSHMDTIENHGELADETGEIGAMA